MQLLEFLFWVFIFLICLFVFLSIDIMQKLVIHSQFLNQLS